MALLILGLILFIGAHLVPTFPAFRENLIARFGLNGYKLVVTLPSFAGLILIIFGASALRGSPADINLWTPPAGSRHLAFALMFVSFVLFAAANFPSRIRDAVKHPQVTAARGLGAGASHLQRRPFGPAAVRVVPALCDLRPHFGRRARGGAEDAGDRLRRRHQGDCRRRRALGRRPCSGCTAGRARRLLG